MNNKKILVIGAGNLGSRHLQGLAKVEQSLDIYVYDPSLESIRLAGERFDSVRTRSDITLTKLESIADAPVDIDLAIVATTANVRLKVLRQLVDLLNIDKMLLEKVLFQDLREYDEASALLGDLARTTWVNCAQRLWPFFKDIKARYANDPDLRINITGSNWGLGCNSVHNTDIVKFLWSDSAKHEALLDSSVINSKRKGFMEFTGEIITRVLTGGELRQFSYASGTAPFVITASHPQETLVWDVSNSKLYTSNVQTGWSPKESDLSAPYQSQLTTDVVTAILADSDCGLPDFATSARVHVETLSALLTGMRRHGVNLGNMCPVT
jgi:hypothetical protein